MPAKRFEYHCKNCGALMVSRRSPDSSKRPIYCSASCYHAYRTADSIQRRTFVCEVCGNEFVGDRFDSRFCSIQCLGISRRQTDPRECRHCHKPFYQKPTAPDLFCSRECYDAWRRENARVSVCEICGKEFGGGNDKYCSRECYESRPKTGEYKTCDYCGNEFYICATHADLTRFCSMECRIAYAGPTSIEKILTDALDARGVKYHFQYPLDRFRIDIAFPNAKLAVEADGEYWHALPENIDRDRRKDEHIALIGWRILHLPEDLIRSDTERCLDLIFAYL